MEVSTVPLMAIEHFLILGAIILVLISPPRRKPKKPKFERYIPTHEDLWHVLRRAQKTVDDSLKMIYEDKVGKGE